VDVANVMAVGRKLRQDVATDEVRKASRVRAPDSPMSSEGMEPERLDQTKNITKPKTPGDGNAHNTSLSPSYRHVARLSLVGWDDVRCQFGD
jgi:hypothetical protein